MKRKKTILNFSGTAAKIAAKTAAKTAGILAAGVVTAAICGCSPDKVDYNKDLVTDEIVEENVTAEKLTGNTQALGLTGETAWNEVLTVENGVDRPVEITIAAAVVLPELEELPVVEVEILKQQPDYCEKLAAGLFGTYGTTGGEDPEQPVYTGQRDGADYLLWLSDPYEENIGEPISQSIHFCPKNAASVCPEAVGKADSYREHPSLTEEKYERLAGNACSLSVEEAEQLARDFLQELDLEYPVLSTTKPLLWGTAETAGTVEDWPACGYVFTFDYGMDGVSFTGTGSYSNATLGEQNEGQESLYSMDARAVLSVTDRGVIEMHAYNPVKTIDHSAAVELLPFETVQNIIREELLQHYENFRFTCLVPGKLQFTHMELIYFRMRDKEKAGHYSYVPAWRLSELYQTGEQEVSNNPVLINAIDGSVIDLYSEL